MKKIIYNVLFVSVLLSIVACSEPDEGSVPQEEKGTFNFWVKIGTQPNLSTLVLSLESVEEGILDFQGKGVDVTEKLPSGLIKRGEYYYSVSNDGRFGKYQITDGQLKTIQEIPFNLFTSYTYAWKDNNNLIMIGLNADSTKGLYAKVNVNDMTLKTGEFNIGSKPQGYSSHLISSARYRNDDKIFLGVTYVADALYPGFDIYVLDANTMEIEKTINSNKASLYGNTAFRDFYQSGSFLDENNNLYFTAANNPGSGKPNMLLRIKNGTTEIDESYEGFKSNAELITGITYLGNGKVIAAISDYSQLQPNDLHIHSFYEGNINSKTWKKLNQIPVNNEFSSANMALDAVNEKVYLITNNTKETGDSYVYIYNIGNGNVTKGMTIPRQYNKLIRLDYMK